MTHEQIRKLFLVNETETHVGEPQFWLHLKSGRSIELTLESNGIPKPEQFYSVRLHCTDGEFESGIYQGTMGIIAQDLTACFKDKSPDALFEEAIRYAFGMIETYHETPVS